MYTFNLSFDINLSIPVKLVIEPQESIWNNALNLANQLINNMIGRLSTLYFLGNSNPYHFYNVDDFNGDAPGWFQKNMNRVSLLRPIFEKEKNSNSALIVITSCPPIDIEDWTNKPIIKRTVFVNINTNNNNAFNNYSNFINVVNYQNGIYYNIVNAVNNPATGIYIQGNGFVPIQWKTDPSVQTDVSYQNGIFQLTINPGQNPSLGLSLKCLGINQPSAFINRANGQIQQISGKSLSSSYFGGTQWQRIPDNIHQVIAAGKSGRNFKCPRCGNKHPYNTLVCPQDGLILQGLPLNSLLLFDNNDQYLVLSNQFAYPLDDNLSRIITKDGKIYELKNNNWKFIKSIKPYEEVVKNAMWALLHNI